MTATRQLKRHRRHVPIFRSFGGYSPPAVPLGPALPCLADLEHLGGADGAGALGGGLAVLHRHHHRVFDFALLFALDAVCLHVFSPVASVVLRSAYPVTGASGMQWDAKATD